MILMDYPLLVVPFRQSGLRQQLRLVQLGVVMNDFQNTAHFRTSPVKIGTASRGSLMWSCDDESPVLEMLVFTGLALAS